MAEDKVHFLDARGPEGVRLYVIGDVHGCIDLLKYMHANILEDIERDRVGNWRIVLVGDYCDRGPDTRATIEFLIELSSRDDRVIALQGNHDQGFVQFLDEPDAGGVFANYGGVETAASYGVELDTRTSGSLMISHEALVSAVPGDHRRFLSTLPLSAEFGDFFICHAGIRPGVALDRQNPFDLVWIRSPFLDYPDLQPKVVVHGHTPCQSAEIMPNRVNVDTGAVWSGVLTALVVDGSDKRLIEVSGSRR